jgi:hypothetical protein
MPYSIRKLSKPVKNTKNEVCTYEVIKKDTGESVGKVPSKQAAIRMLAALHANAD